MKRLFALSILVLSTAAFVQAQPKAAPSATPAKATTKFDGNVEFPNVVGWKLDPKFVYPQPEAGYSVGYNSPQGGAVTVYVYQNGLKTIPNSLTGAITREMSDAQVGIQNFVDRGTYQYAKLLRSETIDLGGPSGRVKALYTGYDLGVQGMAAVSEIYLFPYQNYFIKIRATRRKELAKSEAFAKLLTELDLLFSK